MMRKDKLMFFWNRLENGMCKVANLPQCAFVAAKLQEILQAARVNRPCELGAVAFGHGKFCHIVAHVLAQQQAQILERGNRGAIHARIACEDDETFGAPLVVALLDWQERALFAQFFERVARGFDAQRRDSVPSKLLKAGAANAADIEMIHQVFERARMAILVAHALDEVAINLAPAIALGKALPTCANRMRTNGNGRVVQELDNDFIGCLLCQCRLLCVFGD